MNATRHFLAALIMISTLWVFVGGCALRMSWPKHEVKVIATAIHPEAIEAATITQLITVYDAVELLSCASLEETPAIPGFTTFNLISSAHAHGPSTPTRQGVPIVIDWAKAGSPAELARFEPPPGDYCAIRLDLGPADADALGAPSASMTGKTLLAERSQPSQGWLRAATSARADVVFYFEQPWRFPDDQDLRATLTLELDLSVLLSGEPPVEQGEEAAGRALLQGVRQSISLERAL